MRPPRRRPILRRRPGLLVAAAVLVTACAPAGPATAPAPPSPSASPTSASPVAVPTVVTDATLPRLPLAGFLPDAPGWPDRLADGTPKAADGAATADPARAVDRGIVMGGVGSDLYPAAAPDEYWMITDRGPNGQVEVDGTDRRTFPVPTYDPLILRVRVEAPSTLRITQVIPLRTADGRPVTGVSNDADRDEKPYDYTATTELPTNPSGLDTEGMVRAPGGEFWLSEEYSPSILRVSPDGTVLTRYVPKGVTLPGAGYPVVEALPAVLATRDGNRGFESLALSPDARTLYAAVQSPLANPDGDAAETSRSVRVLALDTATGEPTAQYVYRMEDVAGFDPAAEGDQSEMKISGLAWYGPDQLLVDERTDDVARLYVVALSGATNILGGVLDDPAHTPGLEAADPAGVTPLAKTLLLDVTAAVPGAPRKIEGIAVRDPSTVVLANDNDFDMRDGPEAFDAQGMLRDTGIPSRLLVVRLPPR